MDILYLNIKIGAVIKNEKTILNYSKKQLKILNLHLVCFLNICKKNWDLN